MINYLETDSTKKLCIIKYEKLGEIVIRRVMNLSINIGWVEGRGNL